LPGPSPIAEAWTHGTNGTPGHAGYGDYDTYEDTTDPAPSDHVTDVLEVVQDMLVDVIGPEYLIDLSIGLDTSFDEDLELESLEFVALAERLLQHYGGQVDFVAWLATMELDEIISLGVGDLVAFIVTSTSDTDDTSSAA